jgi:predicted nucleotidyltransferase
VILFGSVARDEATSYSDIDLYVESDTMTTGKLNTCKRFKDFHKDLYSSFEGTEFDILSYGGTRDIALVKKTPLWEQIKKDGVVLYDKGTEAV